jgi:nucleoid-associated protein YgaU
MTATPEIGRQPRQSAGALRVGCLVGIEAVTVVALHQLGRYSWMRVDWSHLAGWLQDSAAEDVLLGLVRTVALVLAWWLLLSTLLYIAAALIGARRALRSVGWLMLPLVRRVLDGALAVSIAGGATLASSSTTLALLAPAIEATPSPAPANRPPESIALRLAIYRARAPLPAPRDEAVTYEVRPGDSLWEIAEAELGDPMRWVEIWDLNRSRLQSVGSSDPNVLHVGWVLELPDRAATEARPTGTYTVQPGDTLWSIAGDELGDPHRFAEIVGLNLGRAQPDGASLTDPDLIRPGWQLRLPGAATNESASAPDPTMPVPSPVPPEPPASREPNPPDTPSTLPSDDMTNGPTTTAVVPPPEGTDDNTTSDRSPSTPSTPADDGGSDQPPDDESPMAVNVPVLAGVTGATVLATGLMLHLRRLRRRRTTVTARARWRPLHRSQADAEQAIVAAADLPLVRWAGQELAQLVARLSVRELAGAAPVAIELSAETGIELLWDRPPPGVAPPAPWSATDGGWAWRLAYDPDAPVPADSRPTPLPAVVTIGERDGRQLLVDLEAFGSISVSGDPARVADFGRAVALELGSDDDLADAFVSTVGVEVSGCGHLPRLNTVSASEARAALRATVSSVGEALARAELSSTFGLRVGQHDTHLEAIVVVADVNDPEVAAAAFVDASPPRRGVATLLLGDAESATAQIVISADGTARLDPLGVTFRAAALPTASGDDVAELLAGEASTDDAPPRAADERSDETCLPAEPNASGNGHQAPLPLTDEPAVIDDTPPSDRLVERSRPGETGPVAQPELEPADDDDDAHNADGRLRVRVLGPPHVVEWPHLRRRELALVVYLACRGEPVQASSVQHALWGGRAVQGKTFWNLVARTRTALGVIDGEAVMPPADRSRNTLALSDLVTTDLSVLRTLYERALRAPSARAIALLQDALALVEGEPFNAAGYDWAHHDHQYVAEASALIEQAVEHLVELTTQAGKLDVARGALVRGLRGLPGNEVLYRARMRLEHDAGNLAGVKTAWDELVAYLDDLYTEPSEATEALYRELVATTKH